jgi:cob(I)alamin adenosyltransferase
MQPSVDDEVAALRAQFVENLNAVRTELQSARASLTERKTAYDTERAQYERLTRRVLNPTQGTGSLPSIPSATHTWLNGEARAQLIQAQSAFRQLERQIGSLEQDLSKWADEVSYLDRILAGDKVSSVRLVASRPKAPLIEFDNISPAAGVAR